VRFQGSGFGQRGIAMLCVYGMLTGSLRAQVPTSSQTQGSTASPESGAPLRFEVPKSHNPLNAYSPDSVPEPALANSARLLQLIRDGKLYLSLKDAINLALENNLDLAIARYNLPIADTDILRNPGGRILPRREHRSGTGNSRGRRGRFWYGAPGAGAGGTSSGAGGAGAGASGLVQSTLGAGTPVRPMIRALRSRSELNIRPRHWPTCKFMGAFAAIEHWSGHIRYLQAFPTGTNIFFPVQPIAASRQRLSFSVARHKAGCFALRSSRNARGFGFGPNLRYLRIAPKQEDSDIAFKTSHRHVTQIENIYWDLVSAYEQTQVNEQSSAFAQQTLDNARKQLKLERHS